MAQKKIGVTEEVASEFETLFDDFPNGMYMSCSDLMTELIKEHKELKQRKKESERLAPV